MDARTHFFALRAEDLSNAKRRCRRTCRFTIFVLVDIQGLGRLCACGLLHSLRRSYDT